MALLNEINVKGVSHPIVTDDGYYQEMTVGDAEQLVATTFTEDDAPYNFRTAGGAIDIGDRKQVEGIVGGTVAWNQILQNTGCFYLFSGTAEINTYDTDTHEQIIKMQSNGNIASYYGFTSNNSLTKYIGHVLLFMCDIKCDVQADTLAIAHQTYGTNTQTITGSYQKFANMVKVPDSTGATFFGIKDERSTKGKIYFKDVQCFDLTQMFGSTIADYIYSLEQANAGAGVAWFKKYFPKPYYEYNTGELMSVKALRHITRGFNAWDEEWKAGVINSDGTITTSGSTRISSKNFIPVIPNMTYCLSWEGNFNAGRGAYYDADKNFVQYLSDFPAGNLTTVGTRRYGTFTVPDGVAYIKFCTNSQYGTTYKNDICINLHWDGERDGEYEEYVEHVYELDPDLELRGIPKLTAGNDLYYDGDVYEPDGTVTRKYGVVDLGSLNWKKYAENPFGRVPIISADIKTVIKSGGDNATPKNIRASKQFVTAAANPAYAGTVVGDCIAIDSGGTVFLYSTTLASMTATEIKTAVTGIYLVYELATPTAESADPFNEIQICDDFGTEEYVDAGVEAGDRDVAIPVGHNSLYQPNLRAKLEMVPEAPEDDGYYVVYHHNGINEYVPLIIPQELPELPTEDGTYTLKCTVANGSATLSFESEV